MRRLTAVAAVVLIAGVGCSTGEDEEATGESVDFVLVQSTEPAEHLAVEEPFQLALEPPEGFVADEGERDVLVADEHVTYNFALIDGHADSKLTVTAYYLPEGTPTEDYDAQAALIVEYDRQRGNTLSEGKHTPTLVHGYQGVYRFAEYDVGGETVSQQNHYLFAGRHLIQITCQWNFDFNQIYQGCKDLATAFPYPAEWPLQYRSE